MTSRAALVDLRWAGVLVPLAAGVGVLAGIHPRLALVAALGLAFVFVVVSDVTIGLCLFLFVEFLLPDSGAGVISPAKVAGALLALSWIAIVATRRDEGDKTLLARHPAFAYLMFVFVAWVALSAAWAKEPHDALTATVRYGQNVLLFLIVFTAARSPKRALWVLTAFVSAASLAAVYGLTASPSAADPSRLAGTYGEPNEFATYLVVAVVLSLTLAAMRNAGPLLRCAALGSAALCAGVTFLTLSRAAFLALGIALVATILVARRWRVQAVLATVVIVAGTAIYFAGFASYDAKQRVTTVETGSGRVDLWKIGWRMFEANPVEGVGAGNFRAASIDYLVQPGVIQRDEYIVDRPNLVHNIYLGVLAENGLVGALLFFGIIGFSLVCLVRAVRRFTRAGDARMELLSRGLLIACITILAADFFASEPFSKQLWLLLGLGPALLAIARRQSSPAAP